QAEDGIRDKLVTGVQTCALPILQATGRVEDALCRPEPFRQDRDRGTANHRAGGERWTLLLDVVERRLAAEAAARVGDEGALVAPPIDRGPDLHGDDVVLLLTLAREAVGD